MTRDFERAARDVALSVLESRQPALEAVGLHTKVGVEWTSRDSRETCELRVSFWRDDDLVDFLEDLIVDDSRAVGSLHEFQVWLEEGVDAVIEENSGYDKSRRGNGRPPA